MPSHFEPNNPAGDSHGRPDDPNVAPRLDRAAIIARARELLANVDYPTDAIVAEIARLMALHDQFPPEDEED